MALLRNIAACCLALGSAPLVVVPVLAVTPAAKSSAILGREITSTGGIQDGQVSSLIRDESAKTASAGETSAVASSTEHFILTTTCRFSGNGVTAVYTVTPGEGQHGNWQDISSTVKKCRTLGCSEQEQDDVADLAQSPHSELKVVRVPVTNRTMVVHVQAPVGTAASFAITCENTSNSADTTSDDLLAYTADPLKRTAEVTGSPTWWGDEKGLVVDSEHGKVSLASYWSGVQKYGASGTLLEVKDDHTVDDAWFAIKPALSGPVAGSQERWDVCRRLDPDGFR